MEVFCKLTVLYLSGSLNLRSFQELNSFAEHIKILPGSFKMRKGVKIFRNFSAEHINILQEA